MEVQRLNQIIEDHQSVTVEEEKAQKKQEEEDIEEDNEVTKEDIQKLLEQNEYYKEIIDKQQVVLVELKDKQNDMATLLYGI